MAASGADAPPAEDVISGLLAAACDENELVAAASAAALSELGAASPALVLPAVLRFAGDAARAAPRRLAVVHAGLEAARGGGVRGAWREVRAKFWRAWTTGLLLLSSSHLLMFLAPAFWMQPVLDNLGCLAFNTYLAVLSHDHTRHAADGADGADGDGEASALPSSAAARRRDGDDAKAAESTLALSAASPPRRTNARRRRGRRDEARQPAPAR
jgi:hypothetical protein